MHTKSCEEDDGMERAKRRLYVCLLAVFLTAALMGIIYYCMDMNQTGIENNGTLVFMEGRN